MRYIVIADAYNEVKYCDNAEEVSDAVEQYVEYDGYELDDIEVCEIGKAVTITKKYEIS